MLNQFIEYAMKNRCTIVIIIFLYSWVIACHAQEDIAAKHSQFSLGLLRNAKKIEFTPIEVFRYLCKDDGPLKLHYIKNSPADNGRYVGPADMSISVDGDVYLLIDEKLIRGKLQFNDVSSLPLPRIVKEDVPSTISVNQRAIYSPKTGTYPPIAIRVNANNNNKAMVSSYTATMDMSAPPCWDTFLTPNQVLQENEAKDIDYASWGQSFSVDNSGNTYISYRNKKSVETNCVQVDGDYHFIRFVPSWIRDEQGFFYKQQQNVLNIYNPQCHIVAEVAFPKPPNPGCTTVARWQAVDSGVWLQVLREGTRDCYVHFSKEGRLVEWFEFDYQQIKANFNRVMQTPFFSVDGKSFYYSAIEVTKNQDGVNEVYFLIFKQNLD
ncbi:MAG TPA: hypothetical protein VHV83_11790 [Armatimonadota bacterium]|nr:hypothetical protein [Armatimonadota bacterium]